ncbi:MAG: EamA-like transporter family protein [Leptolyngbyaceae cyanobacterium]
MGLTSIVLLLVSVLTNAIGQFFLKSGAGKLALVEASGFTGRLIGSLLIPDLWVGLSCYGFGAIAYILLLARVPLSVAGPCISLAYVASIIIGAVFFKEAIPISRLVGIALIMTGVILVVGGQK